MDTPTNSPEPAPRWTAGTVGMGEEILVRMERAVLKVRERLLRATAALNRAGIPYAVAGGNAVASWVATVDKGAVRNTRDVELLVRREDLPQITASLEKAGFVPFTDRYRTFRDGEEDRVAVRLFFTGERVRPDQLLPAPEIQTVHDPANFRVLQLESLIEMMLARNRNEDGMLLYDLVDVGLLDATWPSRFPIELAARLQRVLDNPDG